MLLLMQKPSISVHRCALHCKYYVPYGGLTAGYYVLYKWARSEGHKWQDQVYVIQLYI